MNILTKTICGVALAAALSSLSAAALAQTQIRLLSSFPETGVSKQTIVPFAENLEKNSDGKIEVIRTGPASVPPFQQLGPLSAGVVDLLFTTPAYHQGDTGVGAIVDGAIKFDPAGLRDSGFLDKVNDYYRENFGVEIIALQKGARSIFILKAPLDEDGRLTGRKISATPAMRGAVEALGGVPVSMPPTDVYTSMEKGTIDGIAFPEHASAEYGFDEVAEYMTSPPFGGSIQVIMANSEKMQSWPDDVREMVMKEAAAFEGYAETAVDQIIEEAHEELTAGGLEVIEFPDDIKGQLEGYFFNGVVNNAQRADAEAVNRLVEEARAVNMTTE